MVVLDWAGSVIVRLKKNGDVWPIGELYRLLHLRGGSG